MDSSGGGKLGRRPRPKENRGPYLARCRDRTRFQPAAPPIFHLFVDTRARFSEQGQEDSCTSRKSRRRPNWWRENIGSRSRWVDAIHTTVGCRATIFTALGALTPRSFLFPNPTTTAASVLAPGDGAVTHAPFVEAESLRVVVGTGVFPRTTEKGEGERSGWRVRVLWQRSFRPV